MLPRISRSSTMVGELLPLLPCPPVSTSGRQPWPNRLHELE
jgi:hypothetical protein